MLVTDEAYQALIIDYRPAADLFKPNRGKKKCRNPSGCKTPCKGHCHAPRVIAWDVESKKGKKSQKAGFDRVFLVGAYDGKTYYPFWDGCPSVDDSLAQAIEPGGCVDAFMRWALVEANASKRPGTERPTWFVAHNGAKFDSVKLLPWLEKHADEFEMDALISGGRLVLLKVKRRKGSKRDRTLEWTFVDSSLPVSLDSIAEKVTGRGKEVFDLDTPTTERKVWNHYNKRDVEALWLVMKFFHETIIDLGGKPKATLAATALTVLRALMSQAVRRYRHSPNCPDVCSACGRICCDKKCSLYDKDKNKERRENYATGNIKCPSGVEGCWHSFFRRAQYGGRSELFFKGQVKNPKIIDINSAYPWGMTQPMPTGAGLQHGRVLELYGSEARERVEGSSRRANAVLKRKGLPPSEGDGILSNGRRFETHIVECVVCIPPDCADRGFPPPLPLATYLEDKKRKPWDDNEDAGDVLAFPTGFFWGVWDSAELDLVEKVGGKVIAYNRTVVIPNDPTFKPFVDTLYNKRKEAKAAGNEALAEILKYVLNSSYGKLGMRELREALVRMLIGNDAQPGFKPIGSHEADGETVMWGRVEKLIDADYIAPQCAVHITALVRRRLWELMVFFQRELGLPVHMTDTDSITTSGDFDEAFVKLGEELRDQLLSQDILGLAKREYTKINLTHIDIYASKAYILWADGPIPKCHLPECEDDACTGCANYIVKCKGLDGDKRLRTPENMEKLRHGGFVVTRRVPKAKAYLRFGASKFLETEANERRASFKYSKGRVMKSGNIKPLVYTLDTPIVYGKPRSRFGSENYRTSKTTREVLTEWAEEGNDEAIAALERLEGNDNA